jgi:type IV pilus assembly protein PilB
LQGNTLLMAAVNPYDIDLTQKLEFILNKDIVLVGANREDVGTAIDRLYGNLETESVDSPHYIDPDATPVFVATTRVELAPDHPSIVRFVNLILTEAIRLRADTIRLIPGAESAVVSYHIDGVWVERDHLPPRLVRPVVARIATMAWLYPEAVLMHPPVARHHGTLRLHAHGVRLHLDVTMTTAPDGPATEIALHRESVTLADQ